MTLRPITVKAALPFVARVHRRLPRVQGAMWAVSLREAAELVGVALVGHPARLLAEDDVLSVLRCAVIDGNRNGCSMLYGACSRAAKALADLATSTIAPGTTARVRLVLEAQRVSRRVAFERELAELDAALAVMP